MRNQMQKSKKGAPCSKLRDIHFKIKLRAATPT
jgi:hypothetical protein